MKHSVLLAVAATVAEAAVSHGGHRHLHKRVSVAKRAPETVTAWVEGPTETVYVSNGEVIDGAAAAAGIANGDYVVVGESSPTFTSPSSTKATSTAASSSTSPGVFLENYTSSSTSSSSIASSSSAVPTTSSSAVTSSSSSAASSKTSSATSSSSTGTGIDAEFPSGTIKCSEFPSSYGAVAQSYLNLDGWTGIQKVPNYSTSDSSISYIETAVGEGCSSNSFCSYACPLGYEKAQWPSAQGSTGQSIGGLYCNSNGYLELSRNGVNTLCQAGAGGVYIQNDLGEQVATCRTDYPGTESMTIPALAEAGAKISLTNPLASNSYVWSGSSTTAQYYVNKKGYSVDDSCVWTSSVDSTGAGNWAPVNIGVGKDSSGTTYISIFPNSPTSSAKLDFNIEITGDVTTECYLKDGSYAGGSSSGCTTGMSSGGTAIIRYYSS